MFLYRVAVVQELRPPDFARRVEYCQWFLNNLNNDDVLDKTFFSDEAWFHLSGYLNSQNLRIWGTENPNEFIETPLHPQKVGVWIAVSRRRIIGPIFFHETITAERYRNNLLEPFFNELHDDELQAGFFQQDNATAHTARETIGFLREFFGDRIVDFPARSPDLTILDYYVFPYLKNTIFKNRHHHLEEVMEGIVHTCNAIDPRTLQNAFDNMKRRVALCIEAEGGIFEHLL